MAATMVETVRMVIQWCTGNKWEAMHAAMSSGRMRASTGVVAFAKRFGLLTRRGGAASSQCNAGWARAAGDAGRRVAFLAFDPRFFPLLVPIRLSSIRRCRLDPPTHPSLSLPAPRR